MRSDILSVTSISETFQLATFRIHWLSPQKNVPGKENGKCCYNNDFQIALVVPWKMYEHDVLYIIMVI